MKISVVIPTRNRRELLARCLESLQRQTLEAERYEVIVVDDGSTDGTADYLRDSAAARGVRWVQTAHGGLSAARNRGNREASGELILCLDDDMLADPGLLEAHVAAHEGHTDRLVQGALCIAASVRRTPFVLYQSRLLEASHRKQAAAPRLCGEEVSGGNISLRRDLLDAAGGFEERLAGMRNTDGELAWRLERRGVEIHYAAAASAAMTHVNDFDAALRSAQAYGRAYVFLQQLHPETRWRHSPLLNDRCSALRNLARRWVFLRGGRRARACAALVRALVAAAEWLAPRPLLFALYRLALDGEYWRGVEQESGCALASFVPRDVPILCYHDVSDVRRPRFRRYILPVARFERQVRWLARRRYRAVTLDALHAYLTHGEPLPARPVVITFDDGYRDLETTATPILASAGFHHVHFINSGKIGGQTDWVGDAPDLPLLDADTIRTLARSTNGLVDFQAHGHGHRRMDRLSRTELADEVHRDIAALEPLTGRPVRYLAYPYGAYDDAARETLRQLPIRCAFTVDQGLCRPGLDLHRLPRVELFTNDLPLEFRFKVWFGFGPVARARRRVKRWIRAVRRRVARG